MRLGPSLRQGLTQRLEQRLTMVQSLACLEIMIGRQQQMLRQLTGGDYHPNGVCPRCEHRLTPAEIIKGFTSDPFDYTTKCPVCNYRFQPELTALTASGGRISYHFYCSTQTLEQLQDVSPSLTKEELRREHGAIFYSAVFHFGSIGAAFKKIGIEYQHPEKPSEVDKLEPFFGQLPDTAIASAANVPVRLVRRRRNELGIPPFRKSSLV